MTHWRYAIASKIDINQLVFTKRLYSVHSIICMIRAGHKYIETDTNMHDHRTPSNVFTRNKTCKLTAEEICSRHIIVICLPYWLVLGCHNEMIDYSSCHAVYMQEFELIHMIHPRLSLNSDPGDFKLYSIDL